MLVIRPGTLGCIKRMHRAVGRAANALGVAQFVNLTKSMSMKRVVRSNPKAAQEVFVSPASRSLQVLCYVGAATQFIFWGNLAQWAGTGYAVKDE